MVFSTDGNITVYSLAKGRIDRLTSDGGDGEYDISGDTVVWTHQNGTSAEIYAHGLLSGKTKRISYTASSGDISGIPGVSGNSVVWSDDRNGNYDIFRYDLMNGTEVQISANGSDQIKPVIQGGNVVWFDYRRRSAGDIYLFNITDHSFIRITDDDTVLNQYDLSLALDNDTVVWTDARNYFNSSRSIYNPDIYAFSLADRKEYVVSANESEQRSVAISGDSIVWADGRNSPYSRPHYACPPNLTCPVETPPPRYLDIYRYDRSSGTEERVTAGPGEQICCPDISGDTIVWYESGGIGVCSGHDVVLPSAPSLPVTRSPLPPIVLPGAVTAAVVLSRFRR